MIVIATGSEVHDALAARDDARRPTASRVRVVSMPCWELFDAAGRRRTATRCCRRRSGARLDRGRRHVGWQRWIGERGTRVGIDRFGASAPGEVVARELGITPEAVVEAVRAVRAVPDLLAGSATLGRTPRRRSPSSGAATPCRLFAGDGASGRTTRSARPRSGAGWAGCRWSSEMRREAELMQAWAAGCATGLRAHACCAAWAARASRRWCSRARSAAGCTCSTPPIPTPCGRAGATGSLFVIASKSGSTIEPEVMRGALPPRRPAGRLALRRHHRPRLEAGRARRRSAASRTVPRTAPTSAAATPRSPTSASCPRRWPASPIAPLLDRAAAMLGRRPAAPARPATRRQARRAAGRQRRPRARQADHRRVAGVGPFGLWLEQLIAESTGKEGTGVVPLADEPIGRARRLRRRPAVRPLRVDATHDARSRRSRRPAPVVALDVAGPEDIGGQMMTLGARDRLLPGRCCASTRSTSPTCRRPRTRSWPHSTRYERGRRAASRSRATSARRCAAAERAAPTCASRPT